MPKKIVTKEGLIEEWSDWLVDAVAGATQDRRFLRGDPKEDKLLTETLYLNAKKAIGNAFNSWDNQGSD